MLRQISLEHPLIGLVELAGHQIWLGWLMIAALVHSGVPAVILGRLKQPIAAELHDKVLYADAEMNRADWMTAGAAIVGVLGIGAGLWWADSAAALVISVDIVRDGFDNTRNAVPNLMDSRPTTYDHADTHPLFGQVDSFVRARPWITDAWVLLREQGHVFAGEVLIVPAAGTPDLPARLEELADALHDLDWQLHDLVVSAVQWVDRPTR